MSQLSARPGAVPAMIAGIGVYRPRRVVTNEEVCRHIDSSPQWIERRSGIRTRRFAQPDETLPEMGAVAGAKALADAGADPADVDFLVVATMSQTGPVPGRRGALPDAIAARLGLRAATVGVGAACSGFTVALNLAAGSVRSGASRCALVVGTERMSDIVSPTDRGTAFLFSDGAGAVLLVPSETAGIGPAVWGSDTRLAEAITVGPTREPDRAGSEPTLRMAGNSVFRWAVTALPGVVRDILDRSGLTVTDINAFIPHQANMRITDAVAQAVGFPESVVIARDIAEQGNTSAASIPLATERLRTSGRVQRGDLALLLGFGAGLSYAGMVVTVP